MVLPRFARALKLRAFHRQRAEFYRALAQALQRNETLPAILTAQGALAWEKQQRAKARAVSRLKEELAHDRSLAHRLGALLQYVMPRADHMMLCMLDDAPDKPAALLALSDAVPRQRMLRGLVWTHIAFPLGLMLLCGLASGFFSHNILAVQSQLPSKTTSAQGIQGAAHMLAHHMSVVGQPLLLALFALFLVLAYVLPRWIGPWRLKLDRWPLFSLYREVQAAVMLATLPAYLQGRLSLPSAVKALSLGRVAHWRRWQAKRVLDLFDEQPKATITAFNRGLLPQRWVRHMAHLARETPHFQSVLIRMGTRDMPWITARLKARARQTLQPLVAVFVLMTLLLGAGWFIASSQLNELVHTHRGASAPAQPHAPLQDAPRPAAAFP